MRFINRKEELKFLKEAKELSKSKLFTVSIAGLRRVGKTRLILETLSKDDIYFFVNKDKQSESLLKEYEEILKNRKILTELESVKGWDNFFKVMFERFRGILTFDEFQNFTITEKSVYGTLQKYIDLNENRKELLIIFSGSTVGLIKKLFSDSKEPLYGRLKRKFSLKPLPFHDALKICRELKMDFESSIKVYSIFGGFPKYFVTMEDENLQGESFEKILEKLFFADNAILEDEANQILSLEFGKRSGIYYDILASISQGNTKISEIASSLGKKETALTRQISELIKYFELVKIEKPVTDGRNMLLINHPLLNFWFRFFYKEISSYKRREKWLIDKIKNDMNAYLGRRFEIICREFLELQNLGYEKAGRWWGAYRDMQFNERKTAEIDIVALNKNKKEILFCECKWQDNVNAKKIFFELKEKAKCVQWNNESRKEHYAIFAKSFREKIKEPNLLLFDLKDLEKFFAQD